MAEKKSLTIALAGNPNSGKTSIFNSITGARQQVGNWPGVTVEKKVGSISYRGYTALPRIPLRNASSAATSSSPNPTSSSTWSIPVTWRGIST